MLGERALEDRRAARRPLETLSQGVLDGVGERPVGRHQDCRRVGAVLGLRQQVGRDDVGVGRRIGKDEAFRGARGQVDADLAGKLELRRRDPGAARPDDAVHGPTPSSGGRRPARRSPARRRRRRTCRRRAGLPRRDHRIHAAVAIRPVRRRRSVRHRRPAPARRSSRATRAGGGTTGDVAADRAEGRPAPLDLDAFDDRRAGRLRSLRLGEPADVRDRRLESGAQVGVERRERVASSSGRGGGGRRAVRRRHARCARTASAPPPARRRRCRARCPGRDSSGTALRLDASACPAPPAAPHRCRRERGRGGAATGGGAVTGRSSRWAARGCPTRLPP